MVRPATAALLALAGALFALAAPPSQAQQNIETSVDRNELARGETLTYTIRVHGQGQGLQLDLTPLQESFDVLGTRTSSQVRSVNGNVESWTDYIVTLFPLSEGALTIPAIAVNGILTDAIDIEVRNEGSRSNELQGELFLELEANERSIYVQEQLLVTLRLYFTINGIRNPQFTEIHPPETVTQIIGSPTQYEKLIDGVRHGVYEKRYAIFPQRSGSVQIPDILFRGEVAEGQGGFAFRNLSSRSVTAFVEGMTIEVVERPESVRDSEFWLPLRDLSLEQRWEGPVDALRVGDTLARTITFRATGLDGAALPPLPGLELEGANVYPEPATIDRVFTAGNILGSRVERSVIVATEAGLLEIPELVVPWWNVDTDQQQFARIPATVLPVATLAGELPAEASVAGQELAGAATAEPDATRQPLDADSISEILGGESFGLGAGWRNSLLALALALALVAALYRAWPRLQRHPMADALRRLRQRYAPANHEAIAYRALAGALADGAPAKIRSALVCWADQHIASRRIVNMEDLLSQQEQPELHAFAHALQAVLFKGAAACELDTQGLARLVARSRRERRLRLREQRKAQRYALAPLYRN